MNEQLRKDYEDSKNFWNTAFAISEEAREKAAEGAIGENGWEKLASSEKTCLAVKSLGCRKKVLDYGCGRGWGAIIAAKSGCGDVTAVEVSENAAETAGYYAKLYGVEDRVRVQHVSEDWIGQIPAETYDGIFCSNVLDVIPGEVAEDIIRNFERAAMPGASVVISMNYYMEPSDDPDKKRTVKHGNHIYLSDILRLVSRTDEEWAEIFGRYFSVERLEHYAWPGEETERRRIFYLKK